MKTSRVAKTGLLSSLPGLLFLFIGMCAFRAEALEQRRISVALFPTENRTSLQVWESKYYPYSVLEQKMTEYLAELFMDSPMIDVTVLDENGMNRWLNAPHRPEDMAFQMELYHSTLKEREIVGTVESARFNLRLKAFDSINAENFATRIAAGQSSRYTFDPGDDKLFWIDTMIVSLPIPFKGGFDVLGLTNVPDKGQKMSRPTWAQFSTTSYWQAIKNTVKDGFREAMAQTTVALKRNEPGRSDEGAAPFNPYAVNVGRIVSPTAKSTRKKREYVISIGREDAVKVGDVFEVVRSDTYVTVDPENPVGVVPTSIGKVKVTAVQERTAVVRVVQESRKERIQLKDLVMKFHRPQELEMTWETKTP